MDKSLSHLSRRLICRDTRVPTSRETSTQSTLQNELVSPSIQRRLSVALIFDANASPLLAEQLKQNVSLHCENELHIYFCKY